MSKSYDIGRYRARENQKKNQNQKQKQRRKHMLTAFGGERGNGGAGEKPSPPSNHEKEIAKMSEREFNLSERAEALDMELRRDNDGCYWLDFSSDPSFRSIGPMDLDEVEARLEAAERGISRKNFEDGARAQK